MGSGRMGVGMCGGRGRTCEKLTRRVHGVEGYVIVLLIADTRNIAFRLRVHGVYVI